MDAAVARRSLRLIPQIIRAKTESIDGDHVVVGCLLKLTEAEIQSGRLSGLNIASVGDLPLTAMPKREQGRLARRNIDGWTKVRKDLPQIDKTFIFESPNFGDWSRGSHSVSQTRRVYQRDEYLPPGLAFRIRRIDQAAGHEPVYFLRCEITEPIPKNDEDLFLFSLSLCQETCGSHDIFEPDATDAEFMRTRLVEWEMLPVGTKDVVERLLAPLSGERKPFAFDEERARFFKNVQPDNYVKGTSGFTRYVGMLFGPLLLLENLSAGNAMYVIRDEWETLSKLTKAELVGRSSSSVWRIVHKEGWQERTRQLVKILIDRDL